MDEYDWRTLYPMHLKFYQHLHPMTKSIECVDEIDNENSNLDIFQQTISTNKPSKKLVTRELLIFKRYQVDPKDIKCPPQWCGKHEAMFLIVGFLVHQNLGIVNKKDFFFNGHTYKSKKIIKKLRKFDFCEQKLD